MAKYCSEGCIEVCDFCKHYKDEYRDIQKLKKEDGTLMFAGEGICKVTGKEIDASYFCDDFECFRLE